MAVGTYFVISLKSVVCIVVAARLELLLPAAQLGQLEVARVYHATID